MRRAERSDVLVWKVRSEAMRWVVLIALIFGGRAAIADDKPWAAGVSDADQSAALALYKEGNAFFAQSQFKEALEKFVQALKIWDHPAIRYNAAVCLISALAYHEITTQIPSSVHLAVPRGSYHRIKLSVPVTVYRFDSKSFDDGLETYRVGGMPLKVYGAARTVVDCFKFRNKIGLDVALEALRLARQRKRVQNRELLRYARLLRVEKPMSPYLQAIE